MIGDPVAEAAAKSEAAQAAGLLTGSELLDARNLIDGLLLWFEDVEARVGLSREMQFPEIVSRLSGARDKLLYYSGRLAADYEAKRVVLLSKVEAALEMAAGAPPAPTVVVQPSEVVVPERTQEERQAEAAPLAEQQAADAFEQSAAQALAEVLRRLQGWILGQEGLEAQRDIISLYDGRVSAPVQVLVDEAKRRVTEIMGTAGSVEAMEKFVESEYGRIRGRLLARVTFWVTQDVTNEETRKAMVERHKKEVVWRPFSEGGLIPMGVMWLRSWKEEQHLERTVERIIQESRRRVTTSEVWSKGELSGVQGLLREEEGALVDLLESELVASEAKLGGFEQVFDEFFKFVNETQFINQWFYGQIFLRLSGWIGTLLPRLVLWSGAKKWLGQHVRTVLEHSEKRLAVAVRQAEKKVGYGSSWQRFQPSYASVWKADVKAFAGYESGTMGMPLNVADDVVRALDASGVDDATRQRVLDSLTAGERRVYYDRIREAYAAYTDMQMAKALTSAEVFKYGLPSTGATMPAEHLERSIRTAFKTPEQLAVLEAEQHALWTRMRDSLQRSGQLVSFDEFERTVWPKLREQYLGTMADVRVPGMNILDLWPKEFYEGLGQTMKKGAGMLLGEAPATGAWAAQEAVEGTPPGVAYEESSFDDVQGVVVAMLQERVTADQESIVKGVIADDWARFEREMEQKLRDGQYKSQAELEGDLARFIEERRPDLERALETYVDKQLESFPWDEVSKRAEELESREPAREWLEKVEAAYWGLVGTSDISVARSYLAQLMSMVGTAPMAEYDGLNLEQFLGERIESARGYVDSWASAGSGQ